MKLNNYLLIICFLIHPQLALANIGEGAFIERIVNAKVLIEDFEPRSVEDISEQLHKSSSPEGNLQIFEAVAATYRDLVIKGEVVDQKGRKNLYDQIRMNVAFIQFGGDPNRRGGQKVNRWIRQTLMKYLSSELINNKTVFFSSEEWRK